MLGADLADLLTTEGVATLGTDLFIGGFVDSPNSQVSVLESGGFPPLETLTAGPSTHILEQPTVQVLVRGEPHAREGVRTQAENVFHTLSGTRNRTINAVRYHFITCSPPSFVEVDANHRTVFSLNCTIARARSTS